MKTKTKKTKKIKVIDTTPPIDLTEAKNVGEMKEIIKKATAYTASIKVLGKHFTSTGGSIREAIANLKPLKGQGTAILTVKHGDKAKDRILTAPQTFRLFSASPITREVALKNVSLLFDGSL